MSAGLSKLGAALAVIFAVSLLILIADLLYVIWRRRRFRRSSVDSSQSPSKELLYFFCNWNKDTRIEPDAAGDSRHLPPGRESEDDDVEDVTKWQQGVFGNSHGPSRCLFTITEEEEKEDLESNKCIEEIISNGDFKSSLKDHFEADSVTVEIDDDGVIDSFNQCETTPYLTPCASPPYYTPSPSPHRDDDNTTSFAAVEIQIPEVVPKWNYDRR